MRYVYLLSNMDVTSLKIIVASPIGLFCILMIRILLAALFICVGIQLFDFKNISSFFTIRRIISLVLLILGIRLLINVLFFFDISG